MQYGFLKDHRVRIDKINRTEGPASLHYITGRVTSVDEVGDHEKIVIVSDVGEVGWIKILKNTRRDQHHIQILDWDSKEELPTDRFGLIDLEER